MIITWLSEPNGRYDQHEQYIRDWLARQSSAKELALLCAFRVRGDLALPRASTCLRQREHTLFRTERRASDQTAIACVLEKEHLTQPVSWFRHEFTLWHAFRAHFLTGGEDYSWAL